MDQGHISMQTKQWLLLPSWHWTVQLWKSPVCLCWASVISAMLCCDWWQNFLLVGLPFCQGGKLCLSASLARTKLVGLPFRSALSSVPHTPPVYPLLFGHWKGTSFWQQMPLALCLFWLLRVLWEMSSRTCRFQIYTTIRDSDSCASSCCIFWLSLRQAVHPSNGIKCLKTNHFSL